MAHTLADLFSFEQVVVRVGDVDILGPVDITLPDVGVNVILGPSGAGKSTLLRLCNRLEAPSTGTVFHRGVDLATVDVLRHRRKVGMVFQRPTLFAGTIRQNLIVADPELSDDDLRSLVERVGLAHGFLDRDGSDLSGGEAQRACLARTLAVRPDVVLLDEPTSSLDEHSRRAVEELVVGLVDDQGVRIVWVTHDLSQAERLGGHQVVLVEGAVATADDRRSFLARAHGVDDEPERP